MSSASAASAERPTLGVGIIHSGAIEPLLERDPALVDVLEIEPQTLWTPDPRTGRQRMREEVLEHLLELPGRKLVHSVGTPAGGTVRPEASELDLLRDCIEQLAPPWWSDHLSFNRTMEFAAGFFLPPRQNAAGVRAAASAIRALKAAVPVPLAVENGVNYLRPLLDELPDGEFVARVAEEGDCGVLLDLHNAFTNARNGRQPLDEFVAQLPLERVWELHLAGGMWQDGYWLDAHSGAMPDELFALAERIVPVLPNLSAIVFEIYPSFVPFVGLERIRDEMHRLRSLWALRRPALTRSTARTLRPLAVDEKDAAPPEIWERALGRLVTGQTRDDALQEALAADPAVRLVAGLIHEFRASMIVRVLPLTSRFLMRMIGPEGFRVLLHDFESRSRPLMYAALEATAFAEYLDGLELAVPRLHDVLAFERAVAATLADGETRVVSFDCEPMPLLRAIAEGRLPDTSPSAGRYEIEITGEGERSAPVSGARAVDRT